MIGQAVFQSMLLFERGCASSLVLFLISVFLWTGCFVAWIRSLTHFRFNPYTWLDCKFFYFLFYLSSQTSSCLLAVMCIEKFFALYFPLRSRSICTVATAKKVTFSVTFVIAGINMQHFFIWEAYTSTKGAKSCVMVNIPDNYPIINSKLRQTLYSFAPFTIMVLTNGAIIFKFMRASCARDHGGTESTNQALSKSANRGTAMLITVSLAFLILTGPVAVTYNITTDPGPILRAVVVLLRYVNHSINAVLYCVVGSKFRNELMKTFPFNLCCKATNNHHSGSKNVGSLVLSSAITSEISVTVNPD